MTDNEQAVLKAMKKEGKPMRPGDIAKITELDKDAVSKAINELKKQGLVDSPKRCFYAPVE
ncbi:MAG: MarR family transcriptional regulator [Candidatus Aminicenantes bacterium]|nr:MarR family transcriptional regulator [Candidatus Aminicenantes bacterium]NIM83327.1 MarR family transcriptional regulator [Candidatus Aminicenantes bacterium]NIN22686.1 MarR family transcriptional regulator [Candidatus Aminicenantes bacterium]NIN46446.1 MarR family transcriptional regulator [Candidatus Aminicenantes bacterium]NIN89298.1 MarR family transcriptional regulator [Candidatus Aminicenantes bacterium]